MFPEGESRVNMSLTADSCCPLSVEVDLSASDGLSIMERGEDDILSLKLKV